MSKSIKSFFSVKAVTSVTNSAGGPEPATKRQRAAQVVEEGSEATEVDAQIAKVAKVDEVCVEEGGPSEGGSFGWAPFDTLEPGWKASLSKEFNKSYFQNLMKFLAVEAKSQTIFPPSNEIFTALNLCPLDSVKVVVIGQDPYHGPGQAHGLAFSVRRGVAIPPSLKNMIKEAQEDPNVKIKAPQHGNLEGWSRQGVLMLNTVLTVRKGDANSHQKKGWETFTDAVVKVLSTRKNIVYLLWGNPAQLKCQGIDGKNNTMITTSHPSPLGAYKTSSPFMGSRCFSRCNEALEAYGKDPIDWNIEK